MEWFWLVLILIGLDIVFWTLYFVGNLVWEEIDWKMRKRQRDRERRRRLEDGL